ncbi:ATP-binding protein [bacterium]|nr:ATP-binding protein [bacterium]
MDTEFKEIILDNIRQGLILLDNKLNFYFMNQEAENILGISEKKLSESKNAKILGKEIQNLLKDVLKNKKTRYANEVEFKKAVGKPNNASINIKPILNYEKAKPRIEFVLIQMIDLEGTQLLNKKTKFDEEEKLMSQLFYGLAHEIKNPLAGIKGAAQLIRTNPNSKDIVKECSEIIEKEAVRLSELVNTFKYLQPHSKSNFKNMNLNKIIEESLGICSNEYPKKDINIVFNYESDSSQILCDKSLLRIVLQNIIKNSYDSINKRGHIIINLKTIKDFKLDNKNLLEISIEDSGKGIPKNELGRIFQPFFSTKKNGQGIGLFLSQKIINKFGGFIEVSSTLRKGSNFKIYLPQN